MNKKELMTKLLKRFEVIEFCEKDTLNKGLNSEQNYTIFAIQSKYNNNVYSYVYTKFGEYTSYFISQNLNPILDIAKLEQLKMGDIEFAEEFHKNVIEQYNKQRRRQFPFDFTHNGTERAEFFLKD